MKTNIKQFVCLNESNIPRQAQTRQRFLKNIVFWVNHSYRRSHVPLSALRPTEVTVSLFDFYQHSIQPSFIKVDGAVKKKTHTHMITLCCEIFHEVFVETPSLGGEDQLVFTNPEFFGTCFVVVFWSNYAN